MTGTVRQWSGSVLFTAYMFLSVPFFAFLVLATAPLPRRVSYRTAGLWVDSVLWMLRVSCRLDYVVEGREHLPTENTVVLLKHSSAWETLAQVQVFPRQTWVLKRELLWAPFFGWALALLGPIGIDRRGGRLAVEQVLAQGAERLRQGLWVMVFPEGTRMPPGQTRRYGLSGALLAAATGRPVVPVAHDAGFFWPRRGWLKRPGTIRLVIGPPIDTAGRDPRTVNEEAQRWIEAKVHELAGGATPPRTLNALEPTREN